jgi:putative membrane protein
VLWIKSLHLIAVVSWFAGIFYLPRLFVYHAMADDQISKDRFEIMERKLYRGIMNPSAAVAVIMGIWLTTYYPAAVLKTMYWLHIKLVLVALLLGYHIYCGRIMKQFAADANTRTHVWYRVFNEVPVLVLCAVVVLAVVKPFSG